MESFKASVQYGDWKGTAAADNADSAAIRDYLEEKQLIKKDEFLLAASLWVGEKDFVSIRAFLLKGHEDLETVQSALDALDGKPVPVRVVDVPLTLEKFVALFKRFNIMLTWHGLKLEDREFSPTEE